MSLVLAGCNAGMVILAGDDPGGWGSQNEQDSRSLALAAELPILEPTTVAEARSVMREAFSLSEKLSLPVMVRITRAMAYAVAELNSGEQISNLISDPIPFEREYMRWVVLPVNVVPYHDRHLKKLAALGEIFDESDLNEIVGDGEDGVICAGFLYQKLIDLFEGVMPSQLRILRLATIFPFPKNTVQSFLRSVKRVLILEETAPVLERAVKETAHDVGLSTPIYGRDSGHVKPVGELFGSQIAAGLNTFSSEFDFPTGEAIERERPSLEPLCDGCPYIPTFDGMMKVMKEAGGRDKFVVTGDPGCMVRAQPSPYELIDVKNSLGSGIGMGAGIALALSKSEDDRRVVALCGDSGLLHSGIQGLVDAVQLGVGMLVLILDNGTTALSGGQPHPGSKLNIRGDPRIRVDLEKIVLATGVKDCVVVDLERGEDILPVIETGLESAGLFVVIAKGECIFY
jgi:indolepyruvate ferredoxin oxidoreductase alpha subunit